MTAPRQITASYSPDDASREAASGSSKAPGTHASVIDASSTPWRRRPSLAPASRRSVMRSLNRPQAMATRTPSPRNEPLYWFTAVDRRSKDVIQALQEVAHALAL